MPYASSGPAEIYFETHGLPADQVLLLVNGLGSQLINWEPDFLRVFVDAGVGVVVFDNRDVGLSTKTADRHQLAIGSESDTDSQADPPADPPPKRPAYTLTDMANDSVAVLDAVGIAQAHVAGMSMGGAIGQRMAIDHGHRVLSLTSIMSFAGSDAGRDAAPEALASLTAPVPSERDAYVDYVVQTRRITAGRFPADEYWRRQAVAIFDRCFHPAGERYQMAAVAADGDRTDALRQLDLPALVIHGARDPLITAAAGRATAAAIAGSTLLMLDDMGHDLPRQLWPEITGAMLQLITQAAESKPIAPEVR